MTSSTCHSPHASHSKVYRSGNPANRSVLRTSRIGRAQLTQRGRFKIVLSERTSNIETSGSPIDLRRETKPERVAGALIIGNEERPAGVASPRLLGPGLRRRRPFNPCPHATPRLHAQSPGFLGRDFRLLRGSAGSPVRCRPIGSAIWRPWVSAHQPVAPSGNRARRPRCWRLR